MLTNFNNPQDNKTKVIDFITNTANLPINSTIDEMPGTKDVWCGECNDLIFYFEWDGYNESSSLVMNQQSSGLTTAFTLAHRCIPTCNYKLGNHWVVEWVRKDPEQRIKQLQHNPYVHFLHVDYIYFDYKDYVSYLSRTKSLGNA